MDGRGGAVDAHEPSIVRARDGRRARRRSRREARHASQHLPPERDARAQAARGVPLEARNHDRSGARVMTEEEELLVEEVAGAHRPERKGTLRYLPAWHDL